MEGGFGCSPAGRSGYDMEIMGGAFFTARVLMDATAKDGRSGELRLATHILRGEAKSVVIQRRRGVLATRDADLWARCLRQGAAWIDGLVFGSLATVPPVMC